MHLDDDRTWARIAAESGYAGQAHLIREFRHFTGTTPAALTTGWSQHDGDDHRSSRPPRSSAR